MSTERWVLEERLEPPITQNEGDAALMLCGINASARDVASTVRVMRQVQQAQIKVVKQSQQSAIISSRREMALKRINDMQAELGRMNKLLDEMRADVLHLTTE